MFNFWLVKSLFRDGKRIVNREYERNREEIDREGEEREKEKDIVPEGFSAQNLYNLKLFSRCFFSGQGTANAKHVSMEEN